MVGKILETRGEFRPRQTRQLPRAVDLKGRLLSCY